ncbi:hypothetical protein X943_001751 [Babesia divergens]|uniref:Uncharacterized protein n=1 Tax=Babesia divergens TaxID=32595 RepID=A0AAD9GFR8_BABDI|nr:hypothetical protein X943_001751 [Babesia divergens]
MVQLEELLGDVDAISTCKQLLSCYKDDIGVDALDALPDVTTASASFLMQTAGKPSEHVKATLDNLNHALLIVQSLRHKAVLNHTSDIMKSLDEANTFVKLLDDASDSVALLRENVESHYGDPISLYRSLDRDIVCLERLCHMQNYVVECIDILSTLCSLKSEALDLKATLCDFAILLNIAHKLARIIVKVRKMERTDVQKVITEQCNEFMAEVLRITFESGVLVSFRTPTVHSDDDVMFLKLMVVCHYIFRELDATPSFTLRLVDEIVADTERCLDLQQIIAARGSQNEWQHILLSQFSEFMAVYKSYMNSLYVFCRSANYRLSDHLKDSELHVLKTCELLSQPLPIQHDPLELFSLCELYAKRCVGLLQRALEHLRGKHSTDRRVDISMVVPQLISIGESTHSELRGLNIPFNLHDYYFKKICEGYAKEFMLNTAERLIPTSKALFMDCIKVLNTHNVHAFTELSGEREMQLASLLVHSVPTDTSIAHTLYGFLDRSHCCETLHRHVLQIANSAFQNIMDGAVKVSTVGGARLLLNDGGSKISLKRPNDGQIINARLHQFLTSLVHTIEPCLVTPLDLESQLFRAVQACKEMNPIKHWADDVGATVWHTVSYISSGDCQEFGWKVHQVLTATQHIVKICNFLCENYFNPLVPKGRMHLFRKLSTHAISAFVIYALTVWPLGEDDRIALLSVVTDLEMTMSEILKESLPKLEAEYLASLRRLIFWGEEAFDILLSPDFHTEACLWLPDDVISLHVMTRILNSEHIPADARGELAKAPLHQFLGANSTHAMLEWFRDAMLLYQPNVPSLALYGGRFAEYLLQFKSLEGVLAGPMKDAMAFLAAH